MPKTPSITLRLEMSKKGLELLDIYHGKDNDIIRYRDNLTGKVYLYISKKHVRDYVQRDEIISLVNELIKNSRGE